MKSILLLCLSSVIANDAPFKAVTTGQECENEKDADGVVTAYLTCPSTDCCGTAVPTSGSTNKTVC